MGMPLVAKPSDSEGLQKRICFSLRCDIVLIIDISKTSKSKKIKVIQSCCLFGNKGTLTGSKQVVKLGFISSFFCFFAYAKSNGHDKGLWHVQKFRRPLVNNIIRSQVLVINYPLVTGFFSFHSVT